MKYLVFTLCSNNYLAQAVTLGNSLIEHNPDYSFKIGLVDRKSEEIDYLSVPYDVLEVEQIGIKSFSEMCNRYSITELNTAVKPFFFKYIFDTFRETENVIFLDPDISVYHPFTELEAELNENEIVITPHFTTPIDDEKFQSENDFLNSGLYNLGFIALKRGMESERLLKWWGKRLETKAFIDYPKGLFTDQIWINFAPLFFNKVFILRNPGYNMAYWNLHERILVNNKVIMNNMANPLVFFHFSGYDPLKPDILSKYQDRFTIKDRTDIIDLFMQYSQELFDNKYSYYKRFRCHFDKIKQNYENEEYLKLKKSQPMLKRILRGIVIRIVRAFKIDVAYYVK